MPRRNQNVRPKRAKRPPKGQKREKPRKPLPHILDAVEVPNYQRRDI